MPCESTEQGQTSVLYPPFSGVSPEEGFPSPRSLKWILTVLLVYFGLRLVFYAATISPYVPPDEVDYVGISSVFSKVPFLPDNSTETYTYGLITNTPYLYYWIMGRFLTLNFFGISDLLFLRLINIPLAFATIFFVWRTLRLLTDDRLTQILLIVAITNTRMFSFLSASAHYDNLNTLLAAMAVYYLLAFFRTRSGNLLAASFCCQLAGSLTKASFLPLVLVLNVILLIHEFRGLRLLPGRLIAYFHAPGWRRLCLTFGIFLGLSLNIHLYGGNYFHYGSLTPGMSQVLSTDTAMQNRIEARNRIFSLFKEDRISMEEALAMTSQISHPGDRAGAINLIFNHAALKNNKFRLLGPIEYMVPWSQQMSACFFGICGHIAMPNYAPTIWPFAALSVLAVLGILVRWRPWDTDRLPLYLMVIAAFYVFFLMYGVNYQNYLYYELLVMQLQGRYLFPVLGPIYVLSSYYLLRLFRGRYMRLGVFSAAAVIFIASDFPYFLLHATPDWFAH